MNQQSFYNLIDAYLDGELDEADVKKFEEYLRGDLARLDCFLKTSYIYYCIQNSYVSKYTLDMLAIGCEEDELGQSFFHDYQVLLNEDCAATIESKDFVDITGDLKNGDRQRWKLLKKSRQQSLQHDEGNVHRAVVIPRLVLSAAVISFVGLLLVVFMSGDKKSDVVVSSEGVVIVEPLDVKKMNSVARVVRSHKVIWGEVGGGRSVGSDISLTNMYELRSGLVEVEMTETGAMVIFEGPCKFKLLNNNAVKLTKGRLTAVVKNEKAKGFYVDTPQGRVVDLGTEFGVAVDSLGGTRSVVFTGEVVLKNKAMLDRDSGGVSIIRGKYLNINRDGIINEIAKKSTRFEEAFFTRAKEFDRIARSESGSEYDTWYLNCDKISRRDDLIFFFNGAMQAQHKSVVINQAVGVSASYRDVVGKIVKAKWSSGQWGDDTAIEIKNADEYVEFDLPGRYRNVTMMTWVNFNRASDLNYRAILNADDWNRKGQVHWQLNQDMAFAGVVNLNEDESKVITRPIDGRIKFGKWHHLTTVINSDSMTMEFYIDGKFFQTSKYLLDEEIGFGPSRIGGWIDKPLVNRDRYLNGRVDNLMIFDQALDEIEIETIYKKTKHSVK